ncbi:MAG: amidophosphoribosyltransferase, partial [Peptostreptococcales bacterium]
MSGLREECGVLGIFAKERTDVAVDAYYGLFALQHRGQESCGIVVNDGGVFSDYKDTGLVNDVFDEERIKKLGRGQMAVGHVRYGTTGGRGRLNAQPIVVQHIKGNTALAHNGNLTNYSELRNKLELGGAIFHTTSDTEVISYIITQDRLTSHSIEEAIEKAMERIKGAYSLVI